MIYAEAAYFDGNHCAHVAAWEESKRLARLARAGRDAVRSWERRHGSRARRAA